MSNDTPAPGAGLDGETPDQREERLDREHKEMAAALAQMMWRTVPNKTPFDVVFSAALLLVTTVHGYATPSEDFRAHMAGKLRELADDIEENAEVELVAQPLVN